MMSPSSTQDTRTETVRSALLELHRELLQFVRLDYERVHGRVDSAGELLQLVTGDEAFAWLRPLSKLIVTLDDPEVEADPAGARLLVERLFAEGSDFHARYLQVLQSAPEVVMTHARMMSAVKALPRAAVNDPRLN